MAFDGRLTEITAPTVEPVDLATAKLHLHVEPADQEQDSYIQDLITAARIQATRETARQLISASYKYRLDQFPASLELPRPPLQSVTSVEYVDTGGATQTLSASSYTVVIEAEPGFIVEAINKTWPDVQDVPNAVVVTFVAGYGATPAAVPMDLRQGVLMLVEHWFRHRGPVDDMARHNVPRTVDALFGGSRIASLA